MGFCRLFEIIRSLVVIEYESKSAINIGRSCIVFRTAGDRLLVKQRQPFILKLRQAGYELITIIKREPLEPKR
jgi:hypothetical protein